GIVAEHLAHLRVLLVELAQQLQVARDLLAGEGGRDLVQPRLHAGEADLQRRLHLRGAGRSSARMPASFGSCSPPRWSSVVDPCRNLLVSATERASITRLGSSPRASMRRAFSTSAARSESPRACSSRMSGTTLRCSIHCM